MVVMAAWPLASLAKLAIPQVGSPAPYAPQTSRLERPVLPAPPALGHCLGRPLRVSRHGPSLRRPLPQAGRPHEGCALLGCGARGDRKVTRDQRKRWSVCVRGRSSRGHREAAALQLADLDFDYQVTTVLGKGRRTRELPFGRKSDLRAG
jgi:hypothetical protein